MVKFHRIPIILQINQTFFSWNNQKGTWKKKKNRVRSFENSLNLIAIEKSDATRSALTIIIVVSSWDTSAASCSNNSTNEPNFLLLKQPKRELSAYPFRTRIRFSLKTRSFSGQNPKFLFTSTASIPRQILKNRKDNAEFHLYQTTNSNRKTEREPGCGTANKKKKINK